MARFPLQNNVVMRPTVRIFLALIATPALVHAQTPAPGSAGTAPPSARKKVVQTGLSFSPEDQRLLGGYRLNPDRLDKFMAANRKLQEAVQRNPALKNQFDAVGAASKDKSLSENIGRLETTAPEFVRLLKEAGTSPRDFILTPFALFLARSISAARQGDPTVTPPAYVPAENVAFVEANRTRIENDLRTLQGSR